MKNPNALNDIKEILEKKHKGNIERIILYGSRRDGTSRPDSDYDILVILKNPHDWRTRQQISSECYEVDLKYDILTDVKVVSINELNTPRGRQPFIINALEHGLAL